MLFKKGGPHVDLKWRLIGLTGKLFIDLLFAGSRIEIRGRSDVQPVLATGRYIFAFWHSRILLLSYYYKGLNASIMVSNSADGEIIAQILKRQGQVTVRGSTKKGGLQALTHQIHDMRKNRRPGVVVPDGPQGPRHAAQPGVILLAKKTGYPIIPIAYSAKRCKFFNSWDRFMLPYPATDCVVIYGKPVEVQVDADQKQIQENVDALTAELNRITAAADNRFGHQFEPF